MKDVTCPIIKKYLMDIIEYHLGIYGIWETHEGKIGHGFMQTIVIYISPQLIVDYPITGYVVM